MTSVQSSVSRAHSAFEEHPFDPAAAAQYDTELDWRWWHGTKRTRYIIINWDPDAYGGYLDPAPGYQYEDGPIAESNFGFALSNSTAEFVFDQLYTYENNDEDLGATFE